MTPHDQARQLRDRQADQAGDLDRKRDRYRGTYTCGVGKLSARGTRPVGSGQGFWPLAAQAIVSPELAGQPLEFQAREGATLELVANIGTGSIPNDTPFLYFEFDGLYITQWG